MYILLEALNLNVFFMQKHPQQNCWCRKKSTLDVWTSMPNQVKRPPSDCPSDGRAMLWRHCAGFLGAHSPFNTVHKWAQGGLIEWVCGFLLTLQGPLHPTPASKQIKLQFHHLEGAVSCPNSVLSYPPTHLLSTYTLAHKTLHRRLIRAAWLPPLIPPPKCQPLSTAQLQRGMKGFEGRKRERGGWVAREAKGIGSMHGDLVAASSRWNILPWRKHRRGRREREKCYTAAASR